jgi:hypothetical protein
MSGAPTLDRRRRSFAGPSEGNPLPPRMTAWKSTTLPGAKREPRGARRERTGEQKIKREITERSPRSHGDTEIGRRRTKPVAPVAQRVTCRSLREDCMVGPRSARGTPAEWPAPDHARRRRGNPSLSVSSPCLRGSVVEFRDPRNGSSLLTRISYTPSWVAIARTPPTVQALHPRRHQRVRTVWRQHAPWMPGGRKRPYNSRR